MKLPIYAYGAILCCAVMCLLTPSCKNRTIDNYENIPVVDKALNDSSSIYYIAASSIPAHKDTLPIGILDYLIGSETFPMLEVFNTIDAFDNITGREGADGIPDFTGEKFQCLADMENMPYYDYINSGNQDYLRELFAKNAIFFLSDRYYLASSDKTPKGSKPQSKIIVTNSELASRYGLKEMKMLARNLDSDIQVVDIVSATAKAIYDALLKSKVKDSVAIGVLDNGYWGELILKPLNDYAKKIDYREYVSVISQECHNFETSPQFNTDEGIVPDLLSAYDFDYSEGGAILSEDDDKLVSIELVSKENIARFHIVSLLEKLRNSSEQLPLKGIVITSWEQFAQRETILDCIEKLRKFTINGREIYAHLISKNFHLIYPYECAAKECYRVLRENNMLALNLDDIENAKFISVPNYTVDTDFLDTTGNLTTKFKIGREAGKEEETTVIIPFIR